MTWPQSEWEGRLARKFSAWKSGVKLSSPLEIAKLSLRFGLIAFVIFLHVASRPAKRTAQKQLVVLKGTLSCVFLFVAHGAMWNNLDSPSRLGGMLSGPPFAICFLKTLQNFYHERNKGQWKLRRRAELAPGLRGTSLLLAGDFEPPAQVFREVARLGAFAFNMVWFFERVPVLSLV